jgi:hypothetical protein
VTEGVVFHDCFCAQRESCKFTNYQVVPYLNLLNHKAMGMSVLLGHNFHKI